MARYTACVTHVRSITEADVRGKRVLLRAGFDVPMENGVVKDVSRIESVVPTIRWITEHGGAVIILAHQGRPKGTRTPAFSQAPVAAALSKVLGMPVSFCEDCIGKSASDAVSALLPGGVLLLENLRFYPGETSADMAFAKELAALGDVYVDEAFTNAHRAHASMSILPTLLPGYAGLRFLDEITHLQSVKDDSAHPLLCVVSGAKMETKVPVLKRFSTSAEHVVVGGAIAHAFLRASGLPVGTSLLDEAQVPLARELLEAAKQGGARFLLPSDVLVACADSADSRVCAVTDVRENEAIIDLGPASIASYGDCADVSKTIVWNGPLGRYEDEHSAAGSIAFANRLHQAATRGARVIIGGGDTLDLHTRYGLSTDAYTFVSMGGGAMLAFLASEPMPAIDALLF